MSERLLFFAKYLRYGSMISSATPSSRWLSRAMVRGIDWKRVRFAVELGAGTGVVTEAICAVAPSSARILCIEKDKDFVNILKEKFNGRENVEVIEDDCFELERILRERGIEGADVIISGIPVLVLSQEEQNSFFQVIANTLSPEGVYNQITLFPFPLSLYRRFFGKVRFIPEPRNIPPGGVYVCRSPRHA